MNGMRQNHILLDCKPGDPFVLVKANTRKLVLEYHPDKSGQELDREMLKAVMEAYSDMAAIYEEAMPKQVPEVCTQMSLKELKQVHPIFQKPKQYGLLKSIAPYVETGLFLGTILLFLLPVAMGILFRSYWVWGISLVLFISMRDYFKEIAPLHRRVNDMVNYFDD